MDPRPRSQGRRGTAPTSRSGSGFADGMPSNEPFLLPNSPGDRAHPMLSGLQHSKGGTLMTSPIIWGAAAIFIAAGAPEVQISKTIPGETKTMTVVVEGIEQATRSVTVKKPDGTYEIFSMPREIKRFDTLKVGDRITATYYDNVVLQLRPPGSKPTDSTSDSVKRADSGDAVTASHQRTITATIAAIDQKIPTITFTGPNGWKYTGKVQDRKALAQVKVGDKVDITWTEALIVSVSDAK